MKTKFLSVGAIVCGLMLMAVPAMATVITPPSTLADLISDNASGGFQIQDKIFSNFVYTPGNVLDAATNIPVNVDFVPGVTSDRHGFSFFNKNGSWSAGFTLSYQMAVVPGTTGVTITASLDQMLAGMVGLPATVSVTDTQNVGVLSVNNGSAGSLSATQSYPGTLLVNTSSVASGAGLTSWEQLWFETKTPVVPLPPTMLLLGTSLVGLVGLRWKLKR